MTRLRKVTRTPTESSDSSTDSSSSHTHPSARDHVQSFYLPRSAFQALISLPRQILFAIAGLFGLAHYARQVVRITPRLPATLSLRSGAESDGGSQDGGDGKVSLNQWIERNVPSLKGRFVPTWWLPNGHLQTMYCVVGNFTKVDKVEYKRTYLRVPDGGTLGLDFTPTHFDSFPEDTPTVVACHGLTGGSHESYVRNILAWVIKPKSEGGLGGRAVVVNFRGCAGVPLTSPQLYSAGTTLDLATSLHFLRSRYPTSPLHGIGFSLGASVLSRYLGEAGSSCLLSSGCVLGTPWDTVAMSVRLETHWFISRVYSRAMALNLFKVVDRHYATSPHLFDKGPMEQFMPRIKALKRRRGTTLKQVDEVLTSKIGGPREIGLWPFKGADEYYAWASPKDLITNIRRPTLALNAMDDPIIDGGALPIDEFTASSHVYTGVSGGGGHLGWFEGNSADRRWVLKPVSEFLTAATRDLAIQGAPVVARRKSQASQDVKVARAEVSNGSATGGQSNSETGWEWVEDNAHEMAGVGSETGNVGWKVLKEGEEIHGAQGSGSLQGL